MAYGGSSAPSGWQICDGATASTSALQTVLGQTTVPNLEDRFIIGAGNSYSSKDTGGSKDAVLVTHTHNLQDHVHGVNLTTNNPGDHNHSYSQPSFTTYAFTGGGGSQRCQSTGGASTGNATITISGTTGNPSDRGTNSQTVSISGNTGNKGGGNSHENRPPYYALMFIMKL